jgi:GxxExxY protein
MHTDEHGKTATLTASRLRGLRTGSKLVHEELTSVIIRAAYAVHNILGCGLLEKVYENALLWEMTLDQHQVRQQVEYPVLFRQKNVGIYYADLVVDGKVLVEVKAVDAITDVHRAQVMNYLRISGLRVGIIINLARPKLQFERIVV